MNALAEILVTCRVSGEGHILVVDADHSVSRSVALAIINAIDKAEENGFNHPMSDMISIERISAKTVRISEVEDESDG